MQHTIDVFFNGLNLNSLPGININTYDVNSLPQRNMTSGKLARADRSVLTSAEYSSKSITISGFAGGTNWEDAQANYELLKGRVQDFEASIRIRYAGIDIEYTGTLNRISSSMSGFDISFTLEFLCSNPIGRRAGGETLINGQSITTATAQIPLTFLGSFSARPRITIGITDVTGGTGGTISLLNAATGKGIRITEDFADGDVLAINSDTFEVLLNTVPIDFEGQFLSFLPGGRMLQYIDSFSTRSISLSVFYVRQYS